MSVFLLFLLCYIIPSSATFCVAFPKFVINILVLSTVSLCFQYYFAFCGTRIAFPEPIVAFSCAFVLSKCLFLFLPVSRCFVTLYCDFTVLFLVALRSFPYSGSSVRVFCSFVWRCFFVFSPSTPFWLGFTTISVSCYLMSSHMQLP